MNSIEDIEQCVQKYFVDLPKVVQLIVIVEQFTNLITTFFPNEQIRFRFCLLLFNRQLTRNSSLSFSH